MLICQCVLVIRHFLFLSTLNSTRKESRNLESLSSPWPTRESYHKRGRETTRIKPVYCLSREPTHDARQLYWQRHFEILTTIPFSWLWILIVERIRCFFWPHWLFLLFRVFQKYYSIASPCKFEVSQHQDQHPSVYDHHFVSKSNATNTGML